jgi:hypothetical protein
MNDVAEVRRLPDQRLDRRSRGHVDHRRHGLEAGAARIFAAESAFSCRRSATSRILPAPRRRAIAWPIEPAPMRTRMSDMRISFPFA